MMHPDEDALLHYRFDTLGVPDKEEVANHLQRCASCMERLARISRGVDRLSAWDAEAELDEELVAAALAKVRFKIENPFDPVADRMSAALSGEAPAADSPDEVPPPLFDPPEDPPTDRAQPNALPYGLGAWLGLRPGAPYRFARLFTMAFLVSAAAALGGGHAYYSQRQVALQTRVFGPEHLLYGGRGLVQVQATRGSGEPVEGARVKVELEAAGKRVQLYEGTTNAQGECPAAFEMPQEQLEGAQLWVTTQARGEQDVLRYPLSLSRRHKVHLSTDKPLYQPGQAVHLRTLVLEEPKLVPPASARVTFEVLDPNGNRVHHQEAPVSRFGVAAATFELSDGVALGDYRIQATTGFGTSSTSVQVQRYSLPKFKLALRPEKESWLLGETYRGTVQASYFFGKPVAHAKVRALLVSQAGTLLAKELAVTTDAHGEARLTFELPAELADEPEKPGGPQTVFVQLEAKDRAGQEEQRQQSVTVSRDLLSIEAFSDGPLAPGLENTLYVVTTTPNGRPVSAQVSVRGEVGAPGTVTTDANGVARVALARGALARHGRSSAEVVLTAESQGRHATRRVRVPVQSVPYSFRTDRTLYRPGEVVNLTIEGLAPLSGTAYLEGYREGTLVFARKAELRGQVTQAKLELPSDVSGTLQLAVFLDDGPRLRTGADNSEGALLPRHAEPAGAAVARPWARAASAPEPRHLFVADPKALSVSVRTDRTAHRPGGSARLQFEVKDQQGRPQAAAIGLSVVDESLWALTQDKPELARAFFLLERSLFEAKEHPSAAEWATAQAWSESEQLAAAVLFAAHQQSLAPSSRKELDSGPTRQSELLTAQQRYFGFFRVAFTVLMFLALFVVSFALGSYVSSWVGGGLIVLGGAAALALDVPPPFVLLGVTLVTLVAFFRHSTHRARVGWGLVALPLSAGLAVVVFGQVKRSLPARVEDQVEVNLWSTGEKSRSKEEAKRSYANKVAGGEVSALSEPVGAIVAAPARLVPVQKAPSVEAKLKMPSEEAKRIEVHAEPGMRAPETAARRAPGPAPQPVRPIRVRQHFPETLYVHPELVADENGLASLELPLADTVTDWRIRALASSAQGALGAASQPLKVFQSFFVDLDLPVALVQGDTATIPIAVHNHLRTSQRVRLEVKPADGFEVIGPRVFEVEVEAGGVASQALRLRALSAGQHKLTVQADGTDLSDAIAKTLLVTEGGQEKSVAVSGSLPAGSATQTVLSIPEAAIPGSARLMLKLFPSPVALATDGLEAGLRAPHGCFEQTSSTTYPNVLIWDYLAKTGKKSPAVEERARRYVALGYQKLLAFEVRGGGFEWFGRAPANQVLSAYGLLEFHDMSRVFPVDERVIARTRKWLLESQRFDGSWNPDAASLHDGLWRSDREGRLMVTAYIAWALAESGYRGPALERAFAYLEAELGHTSDAYILALVVAAQARVNPARAERAVVALLEQAVPEGDVYRFVPARATPYYGRGTAGAVEATALGAYALMLAKKEPRIVQGALAWLSRNRDAQGGWHSTQGTVLALRALLHHAQTPQDQEVLVKVNGQSPQKAALQVSSNAPRVLDLGAHLKPGANIVELTAAHPVPFQVVATYSLPWSDHREDAQAPLALRVDYHRTKASLGDIVPVDIKLTYRASEPSGMAVVALGLPAGLTPLRQDLDRQQREGRISNYELGPGSVTFYLDGLAAQQTLSLRLKAQHQVTTRGSGSLAYLYYQPDVRAAAPATAVTVN